MAKCCPLLNSLPGLLNYHFSIIRAFNYMKIYIPKESKNLLNLMRRLGYVPDRFNRGSEPSFSRKIYGDRFPRFHIYVKETNNELILNLHLDQKQPSYEGHTSHSGEYDGSVVEEEARRIKSHPDL